MSKNILYFGKIKSYDVQFITIFEVQPIPNKKKKTSPIFIDRNVNYIPVKNRKYYK